jgi:excisionase family DNA binding protein
MTNELDRLMTITDLSEMLGVPVDTLYGWRHRGEGSAGYRIGRHVRYRRAAVEAWLDTQVDKAPEVTWPTLSGVAFSSAMPPDGPVPLCTTSTRGLRVGWAQQRRVHADEIRRIVRGQRRCRGRPP